MVVGVAGVGVEASCWVLREQALLCVGGFLWFARRGRAGHIYFRCGVCGGWCVVAGWSFVENCTVDASIFVVKLSRANGGCLGTRSR